jgi:hypothetical protein
MEKVHFLGGDYRFGQPALRTESLDLGDPFDIPARWRDYPDAPSNPLTAENSYERACAGCGAGIWYPKETNPEPPPEKVICFSCEDRGTR